MPSFSLAAPDDYVLSRDACSYGYFVLEPNHWDPKSQSFTTTIDLGDVAVTAVITQPQLKAGPRTLKVQVDAKLTAPQRKQLEAALTRMLRLDEHAETIRAFHKLDKRFKRSGRGRLMRSPTFFEDVIKTVTSCNVTWPSTVIMNRKLGETLGRTSASGRHAFPTAERMARTKPAVLRARCSVGYRDARIVELAKLFTKGKVDEAWYTDPGVSTDDKFKALVELPGIGPYAAANILQLLGCYERLPLDTESVRHGRDVLGFTGTANAIMKRVKAHYDPFGPHRFRSYWFEVWNFYEAKRGPSHTWDRETTGKSFTAAQLKALKSEKPPTSRATNARKPAKRRPSAG